MEPHRSPPRLQVQGEEGLEEEGVSSPLPPHKCCCWHRHCVVGVGGGGYSWVLVRRSLADDRAHFISSPVLASNSNVPVGNAPSPAPPSVSHCLYLDYSEAWISIQSKKLMHRKLHRSGSIFEQKHAQIGPRGDRRWTQDLLTSLHIVQKQFWYTKRLKFPSKALASDA
jgi:hypothetical protein